MTNVFDRLEDKVFVPDAQIIFPTVFLADIEKIRGPSKDYKKCFEIISKSCNYLILPSNVTDFSGLILNKLRDFLRHIEEHIRRARNQNWDERRFYGRTRRFLISVNTFGPNLGDLLFYWESKKQLFWSFVLMDPALVKKKMMELVLDKLQIFEVIRDGHEITFTEAETKISDGLFVNIREVQKKDEIESFANDADLMILADCIVYVDQRLVQGIMYLVTNDKGLHGTTKAIIERPELIFPEMEEGKRMFGLEPLTPHKVISEYNKKK